VDPNNLAKNSNLQNSITYFRKNSVNYYQKNYGFTDKEVSLIKKRFQKMAKGKKVLDRVTFREGLGLLGLEHATFLSDRLFNIIDRTNDG